MALQGGVYGGAHNLTAIASEHLQLLAFVGFAHEHGHVLHAIGNGGHRRIRAAGNGSGQYASSFTWVVHQHTAKRIRPCKAGWHIQNTGVCTAGVVGSFNDAELCGGRNFEGIVKGYFDSARYAHARFVDVKKCGARIAIGINACGVNGIHFFDKVGRQCV